MVRELMIIVHVAPNAPFNENWGYQENILPKYHRKLGNDVVLITSCRKYENGTIVDTPEEDKIMDDGVRLIRKAQEYYINRTISNHLGYIKIYELLKQINPDLIFFHGLISYSIMDAVKYKIKNKQCVIVQDNHMDYNIGLQTNSAKKKILRAWYRILNKRSIRFVEKVYGVTPWRKAYASDYFKIPNEKLDVLIMGADDEKIDFENKVTIRKEIRERYEVADDDFLIVTGGKIDKKKGVHLLAEACKTISGVKLLIFGQVSEDLEDYFKKVSNDCDKITMAGWIDANKVYDYFFAADLVFFPGQHSVLWEQACAAKTPCVFAKWDGMDHVNAGGNCEFIHPVTTETITQKIKELLFTEEYSRLKIAAESEITDAFLYSRIAEKSLECLQLKGKKSGKRI